MAAADYHTCDNCGERKTFYDADLDGDYVEDAWRYEANLTTGAQGYRAWSLCHECEQTHEIVIRPRQIGGKQWLR